MKPIYLDYNATTPIDPAVAAAMLPFLYGGFGNPSSSHAFGAEARTAGEGARASVARLLGARSEEIVFTGGGSEANNLALKGTAFALKDRGNHIVTTAIEHPAVLEVCDWLEAQGFRVTRLPVDAEGLVDPAAAERAISSSTILVSVMLANNEIGSIEPVADIAAICRKRGVRIHTDAAQAVGKIRVKVGELGVDLMSVAGHKLYAPKGVGVLYVAAGLEIEKFIHGAGHEAGRRAGTENVLEIVGLGKACELVEENLEAYAAHMRSLRDRFEEGLLSSIPGARVNGPSGDRRLPNTSSVSFRGVDAAAVLSAVPGVAASAGAACHADRVDLSHVIAAIGVPEDWARGTVRFSLGRETTEAEIDSAAAQVRDAVERLVSDYRPVRVSTSAEKIRLTDFTRGLGCACKLPASLLGRALTALPAPKDPRVLVGTETSDDAAAYRLDPELAGGDGAVVQTVDFFTPVVDDPYDFGRVAAANSLSDIYAMGAVPKFALVVAGFPAARLPLDALAAMLRGAADVAAEAGASILGGHTVDVPEPLLGLAVTGFARAGRIVRNRGGRPGDRLFLTKPLGTGILSTARKRGLLDDGEERLLVEHMCRLNAASSEAMLAAGANAATDVTGFGLLGHLLGMVGAEGGDATAEIFAERVPLLPRVRDLAVAGCVPGGSRANLDHASPCIGFGERFPEVMRLVLADAQTSGGLLVAVPDAAAPRFVDEIASRGGEAAEIGRLVPRGGKAILVL